MMNIQDAKEIVAQKDGYSNYDQIRESLQEEYTRRAYELVMSKMYSENEVMVLCSELWVEHIHETTAINFFSWFDQNKKK